MSIKLIAFRLQKEGKSYRQIAQTLNISKTAAFEYVKEMSLSLKQQQAKKVAQLESNFDTENQKEILIETDNENYLEPIALKEFTGDELVQKEFECLDFEGKFLTLIGKPSKMFSGIIWGMPKGGKSNFAIRFADYLQEYFGQVLYVAAEEGESVSLQEKFKDIDGSKITVIETRDRIAIANFLQQRQEFNFIFIDSINNAGIDNDFLEELKAENTHRSFISIVQATKSGKFKGDQALTHNCDFIITVDKGIASHQGRFNVASEISIFEDGALYQKKPSQAQLSNTKNKLSQTVFESKEKEISEGNEIEKNTQEFIAKASFQSEEEADRNNNIVSNNNDVKKTTDIKALNETESTDKIENQKLKIPSLSAGLKGINPTSLLNKQSNNAVAKTMLPQIDEQSIKKIFIGFAVGFIAVKVYEYYEEDEKVATKQKPKINPIKNPNPKLKK